MIKDDNSRHPLFDELEAFHPRWMDMYDTTEDAAKAAGVHELWQDWCRGNGKHTTGCNNIPDYRAEIRREQAAMSSLPFRLETIGRTRSIPT